MAVTPPPPPATVKQKPIKLGSWAQAARGYGDIAQGGEELTKSVTFSCHSVPKNWSVLFTQFILKLKKKDKELFLDMVLA